MTKKRVLTQKLSDTVEFIDRYTTEHGYPPALRDISGHFGINIKTVADRIYSLKNKGLVTSEAGLPRTLRVVK